MSSTPADMIPSSPPAVPCGATSTYSVRRRLLGLLVVPAGLILLAGAVSDYLSGINPVRDAYDQALADAALAIAGSVRIGVDGRASLVLPEEAIKILRTDALDRIYFRVAGQDGSFIAGDVDLPPTPAGAPNPSFRTVQFRGQSIRLVNYRTLTSSGVVTTTVAETTHKRALFRSRFWSAVLSVDLLQLFAILALVWVGVGLALRPLRTLGEQIAKRSARDLEPLSAEAVPLEVRTLVGELNRLLGTIAESNRAERQFFESAAHQLRTPLAGMQAQLELLVAEETAPLKREQLQITLGATQRLSHTTQQLLALARSEHIASTYADFAAVDLPTLAEACIAQYLTRALGADIDLGAELQPASVSGIAWLLAEMLSNLVDNAITYTPPRGAITVRCGTRKDVAFVEVEDTGVGIPPDERSRATTRFFRGRLSRGTGSGLGLAIVGDVARLHNASVTVDAGAENLGTRIRVEFQRSSRANTMRREIQPS